MGDTTSRRYGEDAELEALQRRAGRRARVTAVVAGVFALPMLLITVFSVVYVAVQLVLLFVVPLWNRSPVFASVMAVVVVLALLGVRRLYLQTDSPARAWVRRRFEADRGPVPDDHPASAMLARLCAQADMPVPGLERVDAPGMNACVVVTRKQPVIRITDGALHGLTEEQLEAVLAHELFHVANGDTQSAARYESITRVGAGDSSFLARRFGRGIRELLRARELSADREAVLLTGRPTAMIEAIEACSATRTDIPDADLRALAMASFVPRPTADPDEGLATHPSTSERLDVIARAAAQLGQR